MELKHVSIHCTNLWDVLGTTDEPQLIRSDLLEPVTVYIYKDARMPMCPPTREIVSPVKSNEEIPQLSQPVIVWFIGILFEKPIIPLPAFLSYTCNTSAHACMQTHQK